MNYNKIIFSTLTSVSLITAVVFSFNASGQSISTTDNVNGISKTETTNDLNIVVSQTEKNYIMTESTQKTKNPVLDWFNAKPWFNGVKLTPSSSINLDELKKYDAANPTYFEKSAVPAVKGASVTVSSLLFVHATTVKETNTSHFIFFIMILIFKFLI